MKEAYLISVRTPFKWYKPMRYIHAAIRAFTGGRFNHTSILYTFDGNINLICEAKPPVVRLISYTAWVEDKYIKVWKLNESHNAIKGLDELDKGYDFKSAGIDQLWYKIRLFFSNVFGSGEVKYTGHTTSFAKKKWYCSELAGYAFEITDWHKLTPNDLDLYCELMPQWELLFEGLASKFNLNNIKK